jgi:hypothetical protein
MRYDYKGFWNCDSCCDIEVHRRGDGKHVFVATESPDNLEGDSFRTPVWTRITEQAVDGLIAGVRNVEEFFPRRVNERPARQMERGR